jgi:hypothetical protein
MWMAVFRILTLCALLGGYQFFGVKYFLHLQVWKLVTHSSQSMVTTYNEYKSPEPRKAQLTISPSWEPQSGRGICLQYYINSNFMICTGHLVLLGGWIVRSKQVPNMGNVKNAYRFLTTKPLENICVEVLGEGKIKLEWILGRQDGRMGGGRNWLRTVFSGERLCQQFVTRCCASMVITQSNNSATFLSNLCKMKRRLESYVCPLLQSTSFITKFLTIFLTDSELSTLKAV